MAEENNEIMIEDDAIALEDTDDSDLSDAGVNGIIPFVQENMIEQMTTEEHDEEEMVTFLHQLQRIYGL